MRAKDSYAYNLWLTEATKDITKTAFFLGQNLPVKKVRSVMDICFGIAGISLISLLLLVDHVFSTTGGLHIFFEIVSLLLLIVTIVAASFEFKASNALKRAWKSGRVGQKMLSEDEFQDELTKKSIESFAKKKTGTKAKR